MSIFHLNSKRKYKINQWEQFKTSPTVLRTDIFVWIYEYKL